MRITKKNKIYQITFAPILFPVNCYVIEEGDEITLVDASVNGQAGKIINIAEKIGKPITKIILTHPHSDHIGSLDKIKQLIPEAAIYISERDSVLLNGDTSLRAEEVQLPIKGGLPQNMKITADVLLNDGDMIGSLQAVCTPGHTPGSMSFWQKSSGIMLVGDALQVRGGVSIAGDLRPCFPFPALATWDKKTAVESVEKLCSFPIQFIGAGHGDWFPFDHPDMQKYIARAKKNGKEK